MSTAASSIGFSTDFYRKPAWRFLRECVFAYWGEQCLKCGSTENLHVDHVIPRSIDVSLSLDFHNLQPLCEHCNVEKSNLNCNDYRDPARKNPSDERVWFALRVYRAGNRRPKRVRSVQMIMPVVISQVLIAVQERADFANA
jgi:transcription elongation factor GreA-like protein